jgi:hypothetical protein
MGDASNIQMHDVVAMLQQLQQENANLRNAMEQLQVAHTPVHVPVPQAPKELRVSLQEKFDGDRTKLRDFVNQVRLVFRLQPHIYATEETQVGLIGSLLTETALSWFSSLLEKDSPLMADLDQFLEKIQQNIWRERLSPYSNNKTSNTATTIMSSFSIRCRISTTCM